MSLLSVTVKKARFVGPQASQWNSYVTLKLQHVKSTTVQVKGASPSWEQDFLFELNNLDAGLLIEVWASGRMWDNSVGYHWLHLKDIQHANWVINGTGKWLSLDAELVMRDGQVVGTKTSTGHALLVDARFELPYGTSEVEVDDAVDLQRKLEMYNSMLDEETRAEQARKQHQYYIQCESGVSEDSDYTSDVNYPVGQHPNSSASQFLSAANQLTTPQRSLTSSRENSYEKDDDYRTVGSTHDPYQPPPYSTGHRKQLPTLPTHSSNHHRNHHAHPSSTPATSVASTTRTAHRNSSNTSGSYWDDQGELQTEGDPLYYNSRPQSNFRTSGGYSSTSSSFRRGGGDAAWADGYNKGDQSSLRSQYGDGYDDAQDYSQSPRSTYAKRHKNDSRRGTPSLERQYTMYPDDQYGDYYGTETQQQTPQDSQAKPATRYQSADSYSSSYQQQNLYNAQKSSVYDEYSDQYGDYGSAGTICNDYSRTSVDGSALTDGNYANDTSYGEYGWGEGENLLGDQYNRTANSKRGKALPQLPVPQSQSSQQVSPYASQSTVKEVSISSMNVPSIIATQYEDSIIPVSSAPSAVAAAVVPSLSSKNKMVNSHAHDPYATDLSTSVADESFFDAVSTTSTFDNFSATAHSAAAAPAKMMSGAASSILGGISKAITKVVDSAHISHQPTPAQQQTQEQKQTQNQTQQSHKQQQQPQALDQYGQPDQQQYMDTYENQVGYEEWQNYGYYDEAGNYIAYDQSSYYDDQATITEETVGTSAAAALDTQTIPLDTSEALQYSMDQYDTYTSSITTTAAPSTTVTSTASALAGTLQTTEVEVHTHHDDTYGQYDNTEYYDAEGEVMQVEGYGDYTEGVVGAEASYGDLAYADDAYGYTDPTAYDPQTTVEPSQPDKSKSNVDYNYAYQSSENLASTVGFEGNGFQSLDRSNSVSRRASFKRQTSTRDYGYSDTMESQQYPPSSARNSLTPQPQAPLPVTTAPPTATSGASAAAATGAAAVGAAASAATKLTSEIKSALPQLTSLTKGKTGGLFSSGFSKLGSFVSNAAEKTGVPIPPIVKDAAAAAAATMGQAQKDKEKTNLETGQLQPSVVANHVDKSSIPGVYDDRTKDPYYDDQQMYDEEGWVDGQPRERRHPQNHHYNDAYDQYEGTEEGPESYASGPVHMDSLESNVSEGGRDPDSTIEAQYWQKQKERIAKQNSMAAVDADNFYDSYDPYDKHKGVFQATTDSPVAPNGDAGRQFSKEEYEKQHSLDRDEWLSELDRQAGGPSRPGQLKRGETSEMSMSLDRPDEFDDEYMTEEEILRRPGKGSIDATAGYSIEPMLKNEVELVGDNRKTSLDMIKEKEKGSKSVSFEEEPPKAVPERQTMGMTPREKWLWAMNKICSQLAVSTNLFFLEKLFPL